MSARTIIEYDVVASEMSAAHNLICVRNDRYSPDEAFAQNWIGSKRKRDGCYGCEMDKVSRKNPFNSVANPP